MNTQTLITSKKFKITTKVLFALFAALIIFQAGMVIGYKKATFSRGLGDSYSRAFIDPDHDRDDFFSFIPGDNSPSTHGAIGSIVRINLPTIIVAGKDGVEKIVVLSDDTTIRKFRNEIQSSDLTIGDFVVVLGEPNTNSQIEARLIRILPAPPSNTVTSSSTSQI